MSHNTSSPSPPHHHSFSSLHPPLPPHLKPTFFPSESLHSPHQAAWKPGKTRIRRKCQQKDGENTKETGRGQGGTKLKQSRELFEEILETLGKKPTRKRPVLDRKFWSPASLFAVKEPGSTESPRRPIPARRTICPPKLSPSTTKLDPFLHHSRSSTQPYHNLSSSDSPKVVYKPMLILGYRLRSQVRGRLRPRETIEVQTEGSEWLGTEQSSCNVGRGRSMRVVGVRLG